MRKASLLTSLLVVPTLALAACAGAPGLKGSTSQIQTDKVIPAAAQVVPGLPATNTSVLPQIGAQTPATGLSNFESTYESLYQQISPSVVSLDVIMTTTTTTGRFRGGTQTGEALGSGFVWDTQGHIVTNNHVIAGATSITVTFSDGSTASAKVVGADPNADLAVIQVGNPTAKLVPITLGDTSQVKVGEIAIAIGNPFGLAETMTQGIISGLSRSLPTGLDSTTPQTGPTYNIPDIIQTDAPINPGNSGGVLVDLNGNLMGVTAAIESNSNSSSGIGFVIPTEIVQKVVPSLISTGTYKHPYLGISGTDMTPDIATAMGLDPTTRGALVVTVMAGGPGANGGLKASNQAVTINGQSATVGGDVITAIDGQTVKSFDDLSAYLFVHTQAGQTVTLTVLRGGKETTVKVTTGVLSQQ